MAPAQIVRDCPEGFAELGVAGCTSWANVMVVKVLQGKMDKLRIGESGSFSIAPIR